MARAKSKEPVCLCGECGGPVYSRGLSAPCYQAAARKVRAKVTTWDELVEAGIALPATRVSPERERPITRKITKLAASRG